jgi:glucose/arabinose dehydrogenase
MPPTARARVLRALVAIPIAAALAASGSGISQAQEPAASSDLAVEVLTTEVEDPTALTVADDGRVLIAERTGRIKVWQPDGTLVEAGRIPVASAPCADCAEPLPEEGGLHGLNLAPDFAESGRVYTYYSVPGTLAVSGNNLDQGLFRLSTFVLSDDNSLDLSSEQTILEVPAEWFTCCHYAGDIDFLPDGTLLLSVGDDTSPRLEGWNPRDKRPGMHAYDADRTAQNPADRRGKLLRMMPDGSVPDGSQEGIAPNPHVGDDAYDPYVYAMGFRNPYKIAIDPKTGSTFVGNVGPDAAADDETRGPRGYDEIETVPLGGGTNHGWPWCIADNKPYRDYDYTTGQSGDYLSCDGMTPATVYYPYGASEQWPELGEIGGRTSMGGVVYRYDGDGRFRLPDAYQGKFFHLEWSRDLIDTLPVGESGELDTTQMTKVLSDLHHPMDAEVGPDGAVYLAEYGRGFYLNSDSRISRIVPAASGTATPAAATAGAADTSDSGLVGMVGAPLALGALGVLWLSRRRFLNTV